jgi:peptidoglycan/xylan/chitin deacetylase (PgdA/CDA1 family)
VLARLAAVVALLAVVVAGVVVVRSTASSSPSAAPRASAPTVKAASKPKPARHHPRRGLPAPPADVRGAAAKRMHIPILMYHVVSAAPAGTANPQLWVAKESFAAEMTALEKAGYYGITLEQAFAAWDHGGPLPRKPVVVSFDDGYLSQYTHARPVLRRLGWPGVLNLEWNNLGPGGVTEREVKVMLGDGWELDSHTVTHPDLTTVSDAQLQTELVQSRKDIRGRFGTKTAAFFCYPSGHFDDRVVAAVKAAGYRGATTTQMGLGSRATPFTLDRVRVDASDTAASLLSKLRAAA